MKNYKYSQKSKSIICIIIRDLSAGGAQKQSIILANLLTRNYVVTLMVQHKNSIDNRFYDMIDQSNVKLVFLKGNFLKRLIHCIHYFKINGVDIAFTYLTSDNMLASLSILFAPDTKVIGGIRSCTIQPFKFFLLLILHRLFQKRTIFNNYSGYQNFIKKGFTIRKCFVIHNTIESLNAPINRSNKTLIKIISVGRLVSYKDYSTALESIRLLKEQIKPTSLEFKYIIIGYGKFKSEIEKLINYFNINNIVQLIIQPENIKNYYVEADIYLSTSLFEGFSNTIMEAMNFSLPVVATNVGDNKKLVIHGKTGFLCLPGQPLNITHYLSILLHNRDLRLRFGAAGNDLIRKKFSNEVFLSEYNKVIRELMHQ